MTLTAVVAAGSAAWEVDLVHAATRAPDVVLVRRCVDVADAVATAATGRAEVALLSLDLPGLDADVVQRIRDLEVDVVGVAPEVDDARRARGRDLGMSVVLAVGDLDRVAETVPGLPPTPTDGEQTRDADGRVVAVWGPTGAPGRSTVALGLADEAAHVGARVLLVDADVYGGALAQMLALLDEVSGVLAVTRRASAGGLGAAQLAAATRQVDERLALLTGLPQANRWPGLGPAGLRTILTEARRIADLVVLDLGFCLESEETLTFDTSAPRRNGATLMALEMADDVLAVGSADPLGLSRLARGVFELRDAVPSATPTLVINKVRPSLQWPRDEIAGTVRRLTGLPAGHLLPWDPAACDRAWVRGLTLREAAPDSALRGGLGELAASVAGTTPAPRRRRRPRLFAAR